MSQNKVGFFGGHFDPFHYGHLNSMLSVAEKLGLGEIHAVLANMSPLRVQTEGSSVEERLEMLKAGIEGHTGLIHIDTSEIRRGGVSYTIDTIEAFLRGGPDGQAPLLYLIVGMDQFARFDQWKRFADLLGLVDLVVTSRPGQELPYSLEDWPIAVRALVADFDGRQALLKTGRTIHFIQLEDVEVSSTDVRKKVRLGQSISASVPPGVEKYIADRKLYQSVSSHIGDFEKFTSVCARILEGKGGIGVQSYDLRDRSAPAEFCLIASGTSTRHASALAEHLIREVKKDYGVWPQNMEGMGEGRWVVVDYGALIVHVFYDYVRQEYRLEELWTRPKKQK